jgi:hypothetical protein
MKIYKSIHCSEVQIYHTAFKNSLSRACFESRIVLAYVDLHKENYLIGYVRSKKKSSTTIDALDSNTTVKR